MADWNSFLFSPFPPVKGFGLTTLTPALPMRYFLLFLARGTSAFAGSFSTRFEEIKRTAKPEELYTFLYALPKGGDIHNHLGGAIRSEWWYAVATDPARNGGDTFYTRTKFTAGIDTGTPRVLFQTVRQHAYDALSAERKADFVRLDALTPEQKQGWLDAMRLDRPTEGRNEFFEWIWPRLGGLFGNQEVINNVTVESMKAYGAEGMRYLETQTSVMNYADNAGKPISANDAADALRHR